MSLLQKIKALITQHGVTNSIILSVCTITTEDVVALFSAFGLLLNTVVGLVIKYKSEKQKRLDMAHKRDMQRLKIENESHLQRVDAERKKTKEE